MYIIILFCFLFGFLFHISIIQKVLKLKKISKIHFNITCFDSIIMERHISLKLF